MKLDNLFVCLFVCVFGVKILQLLEVCCACDLDSMTSFRGGLVAPAVETLTKLRGVNGDVVYVTSMQIGIREAVAAGVVVDVS